MVYLLTAIGLSPGGSSTVHIYTQIIHRKTQNKQYIEQHNNLGECGPCPVLASYTLAFALQLRTKQTIHRTTQQFGRVRAVPSLGELYPGICLTTEGKARKIWPMTAFSLVSWHQNCMGSIAVEFGVCDEWLFSKSEGDPGKNIFGKHCCIVLSGSTL